MGLIAGHTDGADSPIFAKSYPDDGPGRYVLTNRAWAQASGVDAGQGVGLTDAEVYESSVAETLAEHDREVIAARRSIQTRERVRSPESDPREFLVSKFSLTGPSGDVWGVGGIVPDVTTLSQVQREQRLLSQRLLAVFEASPTPAIVLAIPDDTHARIHDANVAMARLVGLDFADRDSGTLRAAGGGQRPDRAAGRLGSRPGPGRPRALVGRGP